MTRFGRLGQGLALLAIAFFLAYPVRGFLFGPSPEILKLAGVGLLVAASLRPLWAPLLVGLVPLMPILPYTWRSTPFAIVHLVMIALALPLLVRRLRTRTQAPPDGIFLALCLFGLVALTTAIVEWGGFRPFYYSLGEYLGELHRQLSMYAVEQPGRGTANAVPALSILVDGLLAYLLVRDGLTAMAPRRFLVALAASASVVAILGVAQAFTGTGLQYWWQRFDPGILRVNSTYADPNALAAFLALMLPAFVGLAASGRTTGARVGWLSGTVLVGLVLVLTGSRAGILAGGGGVAIATGLGLWRGLDRDDPWPFVRRNFRRICLTTGAATIALIVVLSIVGTARDVRHRDQDSYLDMALYTLNLRQSPDEILKGRLQTWRIVGLMIADAPAFGVGIGQVPGTFGVYNRQIQAFGPEVRLTAHNTFLNVAAETGITGLAIWVLVMGLLLRAAFRSGHGQSSDVSWMRVGLAGGIAAFSLTMLTSDRTVLREDLVMFGSVAALATAWAPSGRPVGSFRTGLLLLASVLVLLSIPSRISAERRDLPMEGITFGLYPEETGSTGEPFHWTTDRATFHVPANARTLVISLRSPSPTEQTVGVWLEAEKIDEFVLRDHAWRTVRYPLTGRDAGRYFRVELRVSPTWKPADDARALGVMLGNYRWDP